MAKASTHPPPEISNCWRLGGLEVKGYSLTGLNSNSHSASAANHHTHKHIHIFTPKQTHHLNSNHRSGHSAGPKAVDTDTHTWTISPSHATWMQTWIIINWLKLVWAGLLCQEIHFSQEGSFAQLCVESISSAQVFSPGERSWIGYLVWWMGV